ncbi:hypothetical protein [Aureispira anguillae]|uniref:Uncharacterized protein n=1 Tax=Aureispira anguillae TaxID=2864201 RepID=A0A915YJN9_9BACT|nr:hypothetical protein [Aureispira anguillae]BDS14443.1 hypothetical protein AsAng_0052230 [Aureispira anguillae]
MIFSKCKFPLLGFVAVFFLAITIKSCTEKELIPPKKSPVVTQAKEFNAESTSTPLAEDDPILIGLKASEDVQRYNTKAGQLLWDGATIITYDDEETLPLILVPIDNGSEKTLSLLVAAYNEKKADFHAFINNMDLPSEDLIDEGYTGIVEYKTVEDISAIKTAFNKGKLSKQYPSELSSSAYRGVNTQCFFDCIRPYGVTAILSGLTSFCGSSVSCCLPAPGPYNPCCVVVAGCALYYGGTAAHCAWSCWE